MNLREEILAEHSKRQTLKLVQWIGSDKKKFAELIKLFLQGEHQVAQRAAWVVSQSTIQHPELIKPYLKRILENLKNPVHEAVKRNTIHLLEKNDIPDNLKGTVANICFNYLSSPSEAVATRVYAMRVLYNTCKHEPGLKNELKMTIEQFMPNEKPAFQSRGRKILTDLNHKKTQTAFNELHQ